MKQNQKCYSCGKEIKGEYAFNGHYFCIKCKEKGTEEMIKGYVEKKGIIKEAKKFDKELILIRCHAIIMKDEEGMVTYTFSTKQKADLFYKRLKAGIK